MAIFPIFGTIRFGSSVVWIRGVNEGTVFFLPTVATQSVYITDCNATIFFESVVDCCFYCDRKSRFHARGKTFFLRQKRKRFFISEFFLILTAL
jgi:hypothetical protein